MHYKRNLGDLKKVQSNGYNVFSTFSCGWWSSMWYKNAGYTIKGICEIDPEMVRVYTCNFPHTPNIHQMSIVDFNKKTPPADLMNIDILDWSPPCSTFSIAWSREKARGVKKKFREWQSEQVLDDLFFHFMDTVALLRPKVVIAENVKGMLQWNAKWYIVQIARRFDELWYKLQIFLLNGASMWLPQRRERIFFLAHDKKYDLPDLKLSFNEKPVLFEEIDQGDVKAKPIAQNDLLYRSKAIAGKAISSQHPKGNRFNHTIVSPKRVPNTIAATGPYYHYKYPRWINDTELCLIWSWPLDYNFWSVQPKYLIGMSVPPLMMYKISEQIKLQWLDKIPK